MPTGFTAVDAVVWDDTAHISSGHETTPIRFAHSVRAGALKAGPFDDFGGVIAGHSPGRTRQAGLDSRSFVSGGREWHFFAESKDKSHDGPICRMRHYCGQLDDWLGPYLSGLTTLDRVTRLDLTQPLHALLSWEQSAPTRTVGPHPSDSPKRIECSRGIRDA